MDAGRHSSLATPPKGTFFRSQRRKEKKDSRKFLNPLRLILRVSELFCAIFLAIVLTIILGKPSTTGPHKTKIHNTKIYM